MCAAIGSALLWACVVGFAIGAVDGLPLLALGAVGAVGTAASLPLLRRREVELEDLAATDPLTGLANHRGFHQALISQLERARRRDRRLALVMIDIDNFKAVNDAHGHPYGDEVLRSIGKALRIAVSGVGSAARTGGEEFALIVPDRSADDCLSHGGACPRRRRVGLGSGHRPLLLGGGRGVSGRRRRRLEPLPARRGRPLLGEAPRQGPHPPLRPGARAARVDQAPRRRGHRAP